MRFPGFEGEWEIRKLEELLEFKNGINASKEQYGHGIKFVNVSDILNNEFLTYENIIGSVNIDNNTLNKYIVQYGDILFQRSSETREEVGTANVYLDKEKPATFGGFVIRGKKIGNYDPVFINYLLKTNISRKNITSKSGGSTRYNVGQETLSSVELSFPSIFEQEKIGSFFSLINERIQTQSKIIQRLESLMQGVREKVFKQQKRFKNKKGNDFPEWEEKKLDLILIKNSNKNKGQKHSLVQSVSNKYGFINQDEMFEDRQVASKNTSNYYVIEKGHFAYNPSRINVGSLAYKFDNKTSVISPLYISFRANNNYIKDDYLLNWFSTLQFLKQMDKSFEGSVRNTLSYESLVKMKILIPSLDEQEKIVNFLSSINKKIQTEKAILEQFVKQKKYLLQQMFI